MHLLLSLVLWAQQSPQDEDIAKAIDKLYSDRHTESEQGKTEVVEIGKRAVAAIVAELKGARIALPANKEKAARVKRSLCDMLGEIRDGSGGALEALIEKLEDKDEFGFSVASAAADALTRIGDDKAAPALLKALQSKPAESDAWLRYYCIRGLGLFRSKEAVESLKKALGEKAAATIGEDKVHLLRVAAAEALGRIRAENVADDVGKLLTEQELNPFTHKTVAWHAARSLERLLNTSKGVLEGDEAAVKETLTAWTKWYDTEVSKRNIDKTKEKIKTVAGAIDRYKADVGDVPFIIGYLWSKPPKDPKNAAFDPEKWKGPYIKEEELKDSWGRDFVYRQPGTGAPYDLLSWSKDGRQYGRGDDADLWNHYEWRTVKRAETKKALDEMVAAVTKFKEANARFPKNLGELQNKPADAKSWPEGGYIKALPKDGYGNFMYFACPGAPGAEFDCYSLGADNRKGGLDENEDFWNHDKWKTACVENTKKRLEVFVKAIEAFKKAENRFPEKLDDLKNKPSYAKQWKQAYTNELMQDDFGNDLLYTLTDAEKGPYEIKSLGGDGKAGGTGADEDIVAPKK
jgi:general secretion pathway protein G